MVHEIINIMTKNLMWVNVECYYILTCQFLMFFHDGLNNNLMAKIMLYFIIAKSIYL